MNDWVKSKLFTYADLHGGAKMDPLTAENMIINDGIRSRVLLSNKIFQEAVNAVYIGLILAEDEVPVGQHLDAVEDLRIQRRLLRQLVAYLDNKVAEFETLEQDRKAEQEFIGGLGNEA